MKRILFQISEERELLLKKLMMNFIETHNMMISKSAYLRYLIDEEANRKQIK